MAIFGVVALAVVVSVRALASRSPASNLPAPADGSGSSSAAAKSALQFPAATLPMSASGALAGLDLRNITVDDGGAIANATNGRLARLTVDPKLQLAVTRLLGKHKLPQASIVMMEPSSGKILAYASRGGAGKDLAVSAFAPSASVFKMVTGAALVQVAGVSPDLRVCYSGGEQKITAADLKDDPRKDTWCATLAQAMGRSINTVFARLASRKLGPPDLATIASQFGYGTTIPFEVPVEVSRIELPTDHLGFARTAAGFWNTHLSPLHAALLASTVANGGVTPRPWIVQEVLEGQSTIYRAPAPSALRRAIDPATATALEHMLVETVSQGTSFRAFHDPKGRPFLPGIEVAGKTGTLNQPQPLKLFTWFVGYAPTHAPKVAIAALVVNDPVWKVKANVLAREALRAYFAAQGSSGVTSPGLD